MNIRKAGCSTGCLEISDFYNRSFRYLTTGQYQTDRYLQISDFLQSKSSYLTIDQNRKVGFANVGEKTPAISTISKTFEMFSTWPVSKYILIESPHSKFQAVWLKNYAINFLSLPYVYFDVSSL